MSANLPPTSELSEIYNLQIGDDGIGTAGQPTAAQFGGVAQAGYEVVINLALGTTENDLINEADVLEELGLAYVHIPVDFSNPTKANLDTFFDAMEQNRHKRRFVHCIANYRVSAFTMLYRVLRNGEDMARADARMREIWSPDAVWQAFIDQQLGATTTETPDP